MRKKSGEKSQQQSTVMMVLCEIAICACALYVYSTKKKEINEQFGTFIIVNER